MTPTLLVVPTPDLVDDVMAPDGEGGALRSDFTRRAVTFADLERAIVERRLRERRPIPAGARRSLLSGLLQEKGAHPALLQAARSPLMIRAVESVLLEIVSSGADADTLAESARHLSPSLRERVEAIAQLARDYGRLLQSRKLGDAEFLLPGACQAMAKGGALPPILRGTREIVVRHVVDWPPGRIHVIRSLASALKRNGGRVVVELPRVDGALQPDAYDALDPPFRAVESSAADVELVGVPLSHSSGESIHAFTATDDVGEAREIARRILSLVTQGCPPGDIAVVASGAQDLAGRMKGALGDVGITARSRCGDPLASTTVARLATELARWNVAEATRERVCAIVASAAIDLRTVARVDVDGIDVVRHLRSAAIRSRTGDSAGADGFASRLERLARSYESPDYPGPHESVRSSAQILMRLFERLDATPVRAPLAAHARSLATLLSDLGVARWVSDVRFRATGDPESRPDSLDLRQATALALEQAAWRHLQTSLREMEESTSLLGLGEAVLPRLVFADWLSEAFASVSMQPETTRGAAVEIIELSDLVGRRFRHVFLMGASEGRLPKPAPPEPYFIDEERRVINAAFPNPVLRVAPGGGPRSPGVSAHYVDAVAVALAPATAAASFTVSWARSDERGKPVSATPLLSVIAPGVLVEAVPFTPLDPMLAERSSPSIEARRQVALDRASFFRGEREHDVYSGDVGLVASLIRPRAPGTTDRPWSASALERFATCGFRYLSESIWRAKEEDEPDDQAGPMEVGRLAHLAAEAAVREMVTRGLWGTGGDAGLDAGLEAARAAVATQERRTVLGHPELWNLTRARMLLRLRQLLKFEQERTRDQRVAPFGMELSFGLKKAQLPAFQIAGAFIGGQVDRVDVGTDSVMVLDYKSAKTPYNRKRFAEDDLFDVQLQLPIYVSALATLLPEAAGKRVDAAYVSLRDLDRTPTLRQAMRDAPMNEVAQRLEAAVASIVSRVNDGQFPVRTRSCLGCHLQPICRIPRKEES